MSLDGGGNITGDVEHGVVEATTLIATRHHLTRRGILAPHDVSLIAVDPDPSYEWCDPLVTHFDHDMGRVNRYVVRWATNLARGKIDRRQTEVKARFIEGGMIGPVPKGLAI